MTVLGAEQLEVSLRIATVVAPVALYFLLLGFLNTRRHPQLLSGRQDFALLLIILGPLAFGPVMQYLGGGTVALLACAALLGGGLWLLAPRGRTLVIYNLSPEQAGRLVIETFEAMGIHAYRSAKSVTLDRDDASVQIGSFPLLRNISLRLTGGTEGLWRSFESHLSARLGTVEAQASPMAVSLLLVATIMLVAPLALMVQHVPEIVRILTDLLQ